MGSDYHMARDSIEKEHENLKKRLKDINFSFFFDELQTLCDRYGIHVTEVVTTGFYVYQYIPDKKNPDPVIEDCYASGTLGYNGRVDLLEVKLLAKRKENER
jgi:hypothetical protein